MFRLSRIENSTQEIIFLVTLVVSVSLLLGGGFYLFFQTETLQVVTGTVGVLFFTNLFKVVGYSYFFSGLGVFFIGGYLLPRAHNGKDIIKLSSSLLIKVLVMTLIVILSASLATVFEQYNHWEINERLTYGAGGWIGWVLGGNLFRLFGIYGAVVFLVSLSLIVSVASGYFELLAFWYWLSEKLSQVLKMAVKVCQLGFNKFMELKDKSLNEKSWSLKSQYAFSTAGVVTEDFTIGEEQPSAEVMQYKVESEIESKLEIRESQNSSFQKFDKNIEPELKDPNDEKDIKPLLEKQNDEGEILVRPFTKRYKKPDVALLNKSSEPKKQSDSELQKTSEFLEHHLEAFCIKGKIVAIHQGVRLTMFEFQPAPGVKLSKISSLSSDLALVLGAESIRVLTPIPGKTTVGIEVPNKDPQGLSLGNLIGGVSKQTKSKALPIALGKDVYGKVVTSDIAEMPHMLVAGTTGSGKSVFINNLITGLLYSKSPKELRFIMIDPKMIELSPYNGIPHLLKPVITNVDEAKGALQWAEAEMDRRYQRFADVQARNITSFNEIIKSKSKETVQRASKNKFAWDWQEMPYIVVVVDEMADLMLTQGKEVEVPITRIAQKARAAGIHLILATQRPSAEIVTGLIKTNFPTRIAFKVSSAVDSRTILDSAGAEKLLGKGDMLFMPNGKTTERIQGAFLSEDEVKKVVKSLS